MNNIMNQMKPTVIDQVADTLVAKAGSDLTPDVQSAYKENIKVLFLARLGTRIVEALSPEDRVVYEEKFVTTQLVNSPEAVAFLAEKLPLMEELLTEEAKQFIDEFVQQTK